MVIRQFSWMEQPPADSGLALLCTRQYHQADGLRQFKEMERTVAKALNPEGSDDPSKLVHVRLVTAMLSYGVLHSDLLNRPKYGIRGLSMCYAAFWRYWYYEPNAAAKTVVKYVFHLLGPGIPEDELHMVFNDMKRAIGGCCPYGIEGKDFRHLYPVERELAGRIAVEAEVFGRDIDNLAKIRGLDFWEEYQPQDLSKARSVVNEDSNKGPWHE